MPLVERAAGIAGVEQETWVLVEQALKSRSVGRLFADANEVFKNTPPVERSIKQADLIRPASSVVLLLEWASKNVDKYKVDEDLADTRSEVGSFLTN
ncbi:MAG: hypothetical protein DCC75_08475 [Proteobacteria bacterium]|nr:MAG: hypothetical protein DCC75_08475 [Pseudomonadota bacterium]